MPIIKSNEAYAAWRNQQIKPVYVLSGEETFLLEEAWRHLGKKLGLDSLNVEIFYGGESPANDILLAAQTMPFLAERRLIIVKDAQKIKGAEAEKFSGFLKKPVPSTCLVFLWNGRTSKEKKNTLFTAAETSGDVVDFKAPYDNELPAWVVNKAKEYGKKISLEAARCLAEESGSSLLDLSNEMEKLDLFTGARTEMTLKDVEQISGHTRLASLNALAEAVEAKDRKTAVQVGENLVREGEIPLRILATVYRTVRKLLTAKALLDEKKSSHQEIRQELNLHPYFGKYFFDHLSRHSRRNLECGLERILRADEALKSSSGTEAMVVEELLIGLTVE